MSFFVHHNLPNYCNMETSLPLATESFSYSWLSSCRSPSDGLAYGGTTNTPLQEDCQNFNFDISITKSPSFLVHADELFSDGLIKPMFVEPSKVDSCSTPDCNQTNKPSSSSSSGVVSPRAVEIHHGFLTRWKASTRRTLRNLSRYVSQLGQKVGCSRKSTRVNDIGKKEWQVKCWSSSPQASPKSITVHPIGALHDHENSIYEAVLHCKRSIGIYSCFSFSLFLSEYIIC